MEGLGNRPPSLNQALSAIRKLASEAAEAGLLDEGTVASIQRLKGPPQRGHRAGQWLTLPQARVLLAAPDASTLKGLRDRALLGLLLGCGLRRGDITGLHATQLQEREGRLCLVDLTRKGGRIQTIPMPEGVADAVLAWMDRAAIAAGCVFREVDKDGRLSGDRLSGAGIWYIVREYGARIGMPELAPHDLRRTCAGLALKGGATLRKIQQMMGHGSQGTTEIYLENIMDLQDPACDHLGV
jgi:site-specific recombinase XerD